MCAPAVHGMYRFSNGSVLSDAVTITAQLPPNPYDSLRASTSDALQCQAPCELAMGERTMQTM